MKVAFGISFGSSTPLLRREDTRKFMDLVKMADDYGAEAIGTFDTAFIGGDAYVRATLIAQASARARVGLRPTNPLTREPQVMASFLASIDHLTDGGEDRKSTRLNSSHDQISYAVFCLKKKKQN